MASDDRLSYRLKLHILNTKPIDVLTILLKILTRELSINIHALNAKNKHILFYAKPINYPIINSERRPLMTISPIF